ncbi:1237_t:CDS:1, partial [Cetraspora pellucida]
IFNEKPVAIIIDKTTDVKGCNVVNMLFAYRRTTKLVSVDFLEAVNFSTMGGLILRLLTEWKISFNLPKLIASDFASYMKKCFHKALNPIMQQLKHNTCPAHI